MCPKEAGRHSRRRIRHDPQMGAGLAKLHELSADTRISAARNPEAHNRSSARGLSKFLLKAVLPGRRYPARPGCYRAVANWPTDRFANRVGPDIASRSAKMRKRTEACPRKR